MDGGVVDFVFFDEVSSWVFFLMVCLGWGAINTEDFTYGMLWRCGRGGRWGVFGETFRWFALSGRIGARSRRVERDTVLIDQRWLL